MHVCRLASRCVYLVSSSLGLCVVCSDIAVVVLHGCDGMHAFYLASRCVYLVSSMPGIRHVCSDRLCVQIAIVLVRG